MKETENVFIEAQVAKSAKNKTKASLSGGDWDPGLLGWILFCKSQSSVLKYTQPQTASRVDVRTGLWLGKWGLKISIWGTSMSVQLEWAR